MPEKYIDYKNYNLEDSRKLLHDILDYQFKIQPLLYNSETNVVENWMPVIFENIKPNMYEISDYGRVKNINTGRILSNIQNSNGYLYVGLQLNDNSRKIFPIHILVAISYIPKTEEDLYLGRNIVNHINTIQSDCRSVNLEWVTPQENYRYSIMMHENEILSKLMTPVNTNWSNGEITSGENNGMCTVTDDQVRIICKNRERGLSYKDCAIAAGLPDCYNSINFVSMVCRGLKRKNISSEYNIERCFYSKQKIEYDIDTVYKVCELISNGYTNSEIVSLLKLDDIGNDHKSAMRFVNRIRNKKNYVNISSKYF